MLKALLIAAGLVFAAATAQASVPLQSATAQAVKQAGAGIVKAQYYYPPPRRYRRYAPPRRYYGPPPRYYGRRYYAPPPRYYPRPRPYRRYYY